MSNVVTLQFRRSNMSAPVQQNVSLDGRPSGQPGVTAVIARFAGLGWCVLADQPDNRGVSVTNGADAYARAVCNELGCDVSDLVWYELDSDGKFDELHLLGPTVGFAPLLEDGCKPRSLEAMAARATTLAPGYPAEAEAALRYCCGRFAAS